MKGRKSPGVFRVQWVSITRGFTVPDPKILQKTLSGYLVKEDEISPPNLVVIHHDELKGKRNAFSPLSSSSSS